MNTFKSIKYLPYKDLNFFSDERITKTLEYQPTEDIRETYAKFLKEAQEGKLENFSSEDKPQTGYYLYSLIKDNSLHKILQIGTRNGIETMYFDAALQTISDKKNNVLHIIQDEEKWKERFGITFDKLKTKNKKWFKEETYLVLPELIEKEMTYDMIIVKGNFLFDYTLMDFFYADKLLEVGGIMTIHTARFESRQKLIKYIQTNFKNYVMFPKTFGSEYCTTFIKMKEDEREWFYHEKF